MSEEGDQTDEQVRDLLGGLGAVGPIPTDVADRIGAALDDLPAPTRARPVLPRVGRWLVAAAAVVVVAGGGALLAQHLGDGPVTTSNASSAGSAADSGATRCSSCSTKKHAPATDEGLTTTNGQLDDLRGRIALPRVRPDHFAHDVRALLDSRLDYAAKGAAPQRSAGAALADCARPAGTKRADVTEVAYGGRLAQLVVSGSGSDRVARAYDCSGTTVLDSVPLGR